MESAPRFCLPVRRADTPKSAPTSSTTASTTSSRRVRTRSFSSTTSPPAGSNRRLWPRSSPGWRTPAGVSTARGLAARTQRGTWPEPAIFSYLAPFVDDDEMWRTFNMGIGMIAVVDEGSVATALRLLEGEIFVVGDIVTSGQRRVQILE